MGWRLARIAIYGLAAVEIGTLLFYSSKYDPGVTAGSGGQEIGLYFNGLMLAPLLLAAFLFTFAKTRKVRVVAALIILAPVFVAIYVTLLWMVSPTVVALVLGLAWWVGSRWRRKAARRGGLDAGDDQPLP